MFSLRILTLFFLSWSLSVTAGADTKKHFRVGVEADDIVTKVIFDSISENYDLEFAYITVEQFSDGLRSVDSGHIDFFSNVMYTKDRAELFDFTAPTNIEYVYFFGLEKFNVDSVKRLAVPKGTVFDEVIKQDLPRITFLEFTSAEDAIALLHSRQVDGVVAGLSHLKAMKMSGIRAFLLNDLLPIEPVSVIAKKGNYPELLEIIEQHARSGSFQKHLREHIESYQYEVRKQALRREAISHGIDVRQPLKVKLENVNIFVNYHKNGAVDGITADTLFQACDILQFRCDLVSQASESWSSMYGSLEEHSIDILSPMAVTKEREQAFFLSDKYYSPEAILVKRKHYKEDVYFSIAEMVAENMASLGLRWVDMA